MNTLHAKLSIAMVAIFAIVGAGFLVIEQVTTRLYYEELTQRLNAPIAMYVTGEQSLMDADGQVNDEALGLLAQRAMIINPTVEVYLVDTAGRILGHALPADAVRIDSVDVAPIRQLIEGGVEMPFRGSDPRNPGGRKIFSAAEVLADDALVGYLYVVLGGATYDELVSSLRGSYVRETALWAIVTLVALGAAAGVLVFGLMTRRLRRLAGTVQQLTDSNFEVDVDIDPRSDGGDEIDQLDRSFRAMAVRIREQMQRLRETDRLRRELVSNVSHDLRTPLASMQGYIETLLIKNGELSIDERERCLQVARKNTHRLSALVDDLFELSKLDTANVEPSFEMFSLAELLQDTSQEFELDAKENDISIEIAAPRDRAMVYADIGLIQRVLENLLRNAIRFTPAGGHIRISIEKRPDSVAVAVSDSGCGIAETELPRIFDRFYHRKTGNDDDSDSTGLGLAIVKRILDLHDSRITVTSRINRGTRFEFDLRSTPRAA